MMSRAAAALLLVLLGAGCGGVDELQRCIDHAAEEGIDADRAEEACRAATSED